MSAVKVEAERLEAMRKAGTPPQIVYAYKRTGGLLLTEDIREHWPPDRVKEWDDAIHEYFAIEDASKNVERPNPEEWSTEIPEMLASGFEGRWAIVRSARQPVEITSGEMFRVQVHSELKSTRLATIVTRSQCARRSLAPTGTGTGLIWWCPRHTALIAVGRRASSRPVGCCRCPSASDLKCRP
jgi:hypothetical protein